MPPEKSAEPRTITQPLPAEIRAFLLSELGATGFSSPEAIEYIQRAGTLHTCHLSSPAGLTLHWVLAGGPHTRGQYPWPMVHKVCRRAEALVREEGIARPLVLWLMPAPGPRRLPRAGSILQEVHINGGFTYPRNGHVFVYRAEELPKVVLHELLHHSRYHTEAWDAASMAALYRQLRVDPATRLLPNEAIVELWAEHYHLRFLSEETGIPYSVLWNAEHRHAERQARRLVAHYRGVPGPTWRETTHGMSYLLLRAAVFPVFHRELQPMSTPYDPRALTGVMLRAVAAWRDRPQQPARTDRGRGLRMTLTGDF